MSLHRLTHTQKLPLQHQTTRSPSNWLSVAGCPIHDVTHDVGAVMSSRQALWLTEFWLVVGAPTPLCWGVSGWVWRRWRQVSRPTPSVHYKVWSPGRPWGGLEGWHKLRRLKSRIQRHIRYCFISQRFKSWSNNLTLHLLKSPLLVIHFSCFWISCTIT